MVAKKDFHAPKHPEVEAVPNLHVIKALQVSDDCYEMLTITITNAYLSYNRHVSSTHRLAYT